MFGDFFGEYLLDREIITREQLDEAVLLQRENNVLLGTLALQREYLDEPRLIELLEEQHKLDRKLGDLAVEKGYLSQEQLLELLQSQSGNYLYLGESLIRLGFLPEESLQEHLETWGEITMQLEQKARAQLKAVPFGDLVFSAMERTRVSFFRRGYPVRVEDVASGVPELAGINVFTASQRSKDEGSHHFVLLLPEEFIRLLGSPGYPGDHERPDAGMEEAYETVLQWVFLLNYAICRAANKEGHRFKHGPIQSTLPEYEHCVSVRMRTLVAPIHMLYLTS